MNPLDYAEEKHLSPRRIVDFTLCSNPLGPSNKARTAMRKMVREMGVFPDDRARYLRRVLSRKEGVSEECFLFGHGSSHILSLYLESFRPSTIFLHRPYPHYRDTVFERREILCSPLPPVIDDDDFNLEGERTLSVVEQGKTLFLMNPHHLTGAMATTEVIRDLLTAAERSGGMLIVDEALIEYTNRASIARWAVDSTNCLVLRSFSAFHALAGLRIGYGIGHPSIVRRLSLSPALGAVNSMALAAARASVADKGYYKRTIEFVAAEKSYVLGKLAHQQGVTVRDTSSNLLLINLQREVPDLERWFLKRSMFVDTFKDSEGRVWISLPMRRRPQNARFVKTLRYLLSQSVTD